MSLLKPKIINIVKSVGWQKTPSLLDYRQREGYLSYAREFKSGASNFGGSLNQVFSDREIKVVILWALISPMAAVAYLIWIKYPKSRLLAIPLFILSLFHFIGQWSGFYWALQRIGMIA